METNKVYTGDCRELMASVPLDAFVISDPPYNVKYHYEGYSDSLGGAEYLGLLKAAFGGRKSVIIHYPEDTINKLPLCGLGECREAVQWVYNSNTARQSRTVSWWNCKPDFRKVGQPYKNPTDRRIKERMARGLTARLYDWWYIDQVKNVSKKHSHPCPIPYELARRIILTTTQPGDLVVDPFCGSGTILAAAEALGRKWMGIEMSADYANLARKEIAAKKALFIG